uniref:uS10m n=1 Tax=Trypanosoma brucei brucei TaxID=5702 RepID=UPI000E6AE323|nr:Chain CJ, uS10m [Trypanosoma brucei brucei]6HIW_CJ Chain CJ, uS10m [Trypanosoma brucei brucei]6HIZ_CJ Chain CJ, uS10m [Trypanosoma brucei brucei]
MVRRSHVVAYYWSRYRMPTQMPKFDGPAPVAAPQSMNSTKTNEFIDPIDDKFPMSIRGPLVRPDVPEDQYVDSWYICTSMTHHMGDYRPWSASAPPNAFRFRPFNEFDAKGREYVQYMREFARFDPRKSRGNGQKGFPFRDAYLTKMNEANQKTPPPTLETIMDRAVREHHQHARILSPLEVQRDVGRLEPIPSYAGKINADRSVFPFQWKTEDWYEYEVAKVRNRRFVFENTEEDGIRGSEVTYKIVLEGFWDHHVMKLAEDVCMFLKDVGRQIVEEKLVAVRRLLQGGAVDPELLAAFNCARAGPFGGLDEYDKEEVANFLRSDLRRLEEQCLSVINRCNVPVPGATNIYDPHTSWPHVEKLEPWVRMAEFWTSSSDTSFTELEMSTAHYEFRKFFRVIICKLPFQSTEFEKRMYDIRHWLHRQTSCEFHTIYRRNVIHDSAVFPTEHDPATPTTHEHHRMFSFALDWQSAPVNRLSTDTVHEGESWDAVAQRLGCSVGELKDANAERETIEAGVVINVPVTATRRLTSFGATPLVLPLKTTSAKDGERIRTWEEAAAILDCTVEELQQCNGHAALTYQKKESEAGEFDSSETELVAPLSCWTSTSESEFSPVERVHANDTLVAIARRLQCSEEALRAVNDGITDVSGLDFVRVPPEARRPRRLVEPQLRPQAATDALLARTIAEEETFKLKSIPHLPQNAERFPHEYHTPTSRFPPTPSETPATQDWMAYTAKYLDKQFTISAEPAPVYNVNKLWPMQQIPGKVDQTPFEEDQTWLLHSIPVQQLEMHHHEKDLQDLPFINHEQFPRSLEWNAP